MLRLLQACYWWLVRLLARLRYRVEVIGLEKLRDLHGPTLVMPNHPAYIDPPLLLSHIRLHGPIRPIVYEGMYRRAILYPMMRLVEALEVPDLGAQSRNAREQTLAMIDAVVAGLEQGGNFLIYPAGHIQERGIEEIGPARSVAEILERSPQANLVLIRTRGLWGSSFSVAPLGKRPDVGRTGLRGVLWTLANLIFFAPRRTVTMTVEVVRRSDLPELSREKLNPYLEAWYNRGGPETPTFVPYHFLFGPRSHQFREFQGTGPLEFEKIKQATIQQVNEIVEEHLGRPLEEDENRPETTLNAIGLDSLDRMDTALRIEDRFGFRSDRVAETLGELWALAEGLLPASSGAPAPVPEAWNRPPSDFQPAKILAETLAEAFVRRALAHPGDVAVADRLSGVLTYRKLLVGTRLLSKRIREIPGDAIGVMLPASVAVDIVFLSLHMAGKLPVMLNWTTGPAALAHAVGKLRVTHVITSQKLIDRLGIEVPGAEYVFLEDLRGGVGKAEALATLLATYVAPHRFLRAVPRVDADDPAVVLFTSGSESAPKAVPLSHRNLITNARDGLLALAATRGDAMLACLPPFHSFGLTGNIIAPLLGGIRLVCHPDPTDAPGLVRAIAGYRPTLLLTTPTFLGYIFSAATPGRPAIASRHRHGRGEVPGGDLCPRRRVGPRGHDPRRLRDYRVFADGRRKPHRPDQGRHRRAPGGQRGSVCRGSRVQAAIAGRLDRHLAGPGPFGLSRLPGIRRARSVPHGQRASLVLYRRPGPVGRRGVHSFPGPAEAVPQGRRGNDLPARLGRAVGPASPAHGKRAASGGRRD